MENEKQQNGKQKTTIMIVAAVIILVIIIAVILSIPNNNNKPNEANEPGNISGEIPGEEVANPEGDFEPGEINEGEMEPVEAEVANPILEGAVTVAPGADLVTTEGKVVNQEGKEVRTDVAYNSPEAPHQTQALSEEELAVITDDIELSLSADGFSPNEFTVNAGDAVTLTLTGSEDSSHVLAFAGARMSGVFINTRPGETRSVTFNAPEAGSYTFFCDFPGHRGRGEEGTMIVR